MWEGRSCSWESENRQDAWDTVEAQRQGQVLQSELRVAWLCAPELR